MFWSEHGSRLCKYRWCANFHGSTVCCAFSPKVKGAAQSDGPCAERAMGSIIFNAKLPDLHWHFPLVCSPSHFAPADVTESHEITERGGKIPACVRWDCHFTRSLSVICSGPNWSSGIVEIKLTGNSLTNEKDRRANHLLSKMLPVVI